MTLFGDDVRQYQGGGGSLGSLSGGPSGPDTAPPVTVTPTVTAAPVTVTPTISAVPVTVTPTSTAVPVTVTPTSVAPTATVTPTVTAAPVTTTQTETATTTVTETKTETETKTAAPVTVTPTATGAPVTTTPTITAAPVTTTVTETTSADPVTVTPTVTAAPVTTTPTITAVPVTTTVTETTTADPVTVTPTVSGTPVTVTSTATRTVIATTPPVPTEDSRGPDAHLNVHLTGLGVNDDPFTVQDRKVEPGEPVEYDVSLFGVSSGDGLKAARIRIDFDPSQTVHHLSYGIVTCPEKKSEIVTSSYVEVEFLCGPGGHIGISVVASSTAQSGDVVPVQITADGTDPLGNPLKVLTSPHYLDWVRSEGSSESNYAPLTQIVQYPVN